MGRLAADAIVSDTFEDSRVAVVDLLNHQVGDAKVRRLYTTLF